MLKTKRLVLRPARASDAAPLFEVYGDPETMRYWDTLADDDISQTEHRVRGFMMMEHPTYLVIEYDGRAVGTAGIHSGDELGFILHRSFWRSGLMREALKALIPWTFKALNLDQITADADPRNAASIGLLNSLGFIETGHAVNTIEVGDTWCDSLYFRLPRP